MKRKWIALALSFVTISSFAACQATPDSEIVVGKDSDRMIEQIQSGQPGSENNLQLPDEQYIFSKTSTNGLLTINVDAAVTAPGGSIPTARISATGFTQEQVTGFFNYLYPDEKPMNVVDEPDAMTKAEIAETIILYKQYLSEGSVEENTLYTQEEMEEEIARLEELYQSAPEEETEKKETVSDGTMTTGVWNNAGDEEQIYELNVSDGERKLYVRTPGADTQSAEAYLTYVADMRPDFVNGEMIGTADAAHPSNKVKISFDDAQKLCAGFFEAGEVPGITLDRAYVVEADGEYAYWFEYVRSIEETPCAFVPNTTERGEESYSLPWEYERIYMIVDGEGFNYIQWRSPVRIDEMISENTDVISFEEAADIFETMIMTTYEAQTTLSELEQKIAVEIDEICLASIRIREANTVGRTGLAIPAWIYYGGITRDTMENGETILTTTEGKEGVPCIVLAINAIDGSVIDLSQGY